MKKMIVMLIALCLCFVAPFPCYADTTVNPALTDEDIAFLSEKASDERTIVCLSDLFSLPPDQLPEYNLDELFDATKIIKCYYGFDITDLDSLNENAVKKKCETANVKFIMPLSVGDGSITRTFSLTGDSLETAEESATLINPERSYNYMEVLNSTLDSVGIGNGSVYIVQCGNLGYITDDNYIAICYPENQDPLLIEVYVGARTEDRAIKTQIYHSLEEYIENLKQTSRVQVINTLTPKMKMVTIILSGVIAIEAIFIILMLVRYRKRKKQG